MPLAFPLQFKPLHKAPPIAIWRCMHTAKYFMSLCRWGAPATPGLLPAGSFSCHSESKKPREESKGEKKKKKSLRTHDMPSGKLQKAAATGSEDAISCALLWLGIGDGSGSGGSCFPGHPLGQERRSDGWVQRGCCNPAHKGLAPRQNVLFPCKFCCFCWFKTGLRRYFNIVFL